MTKNFHKNLNFMAVFTAFLIVCLIIFHKQFMQLAVSNIFLNGIIIGTGIFGICLCFVEMFKLLPEYNWLSHYKHNNKKNPLPPHILRPIAIILRHGADKIPVSVSNDMINMVIGRFEDSRESIRYITNTLVFLGLLGTFWGLVITIGGFSELISGLNFDDIGVLYSMQTGLEKPLSGMTTAFTSSLLGLGFSLSVSFLALQVQLAQNSIYHELEDCLALRSQFPNPMIASQILPRIDSSTSELTKAIQEQKCVTQ